MCSPLEPSCHGCDKSELPHAVSFLRLRPPRRHHDPRTSFHRNLGENSFSHERAHNARRSISPSLFRGDAHRARNSRQDPRCVAVLSELITSHIWLACCAFSDSGRHEKPHSVVTGNRLFSRTPSSCPIFFSFPTDRFPRTRTMLREVELKPCAFQGTTDPIPDFRVRGRELVPFPGVPPQPTQRRAPSGVQVPFRTALVR